MLSTAKDLLYPQCQYGFINLIDTFQGGGLNREGDRRTVAEGMRYYTQYCLK